MTEEQAQRQHPEGPSKDPWRYRRRWMAAYVLFNLAVIVWLLYTGNDTAIGQTFVTLSLPSTSLVVGTYIFGAAWLERKK